MSIEAWLGILVPVILAICTGLAFLAYRHPKEYENIIDPICGLIIVVTLVVSLSYNFGVLVTVDQLYDVDTTGINTSQAKDTLESAYIPTYFIYGVFAFVLYLIILSFLVRNVWGEETEEKGDEEDK